MLKCRSVTVVCVSYKQLKKITKYFIQYLSWIVVHQAVKQTCAPFVKISLSDGHPCNKAKFSAEVIVIHTKIASRVLYMSNTNVSVFLLNTNSFKKSRLILLQLKVTGIFWEFLFLK